MLAHELTGWRSATDIRLLATLAALLHDLGKASVAFQERLRGKRDEKSRYRHEWVSLRLFLAFVGDDDDAGWLGRLASETECDAGEWTASGRYLRDGVDEGVERHPFREITTRAPLAAAIGWLIVTHHRLPVVPGNKGDGRRAGWGERVAEFQQAWLDSPLACVSHEWNGGGQGAAHEEAMPYWTMAGELPVADTAWRNQARNVAAELLELRATRGEDWLGNPFVMHLARLALMLADHHYSSLGLDGSGNPVAGRRDFLQASSSLFANTTQGARGRPVCNQSLLEHLLGVGHAADAIARAMPGFERHLPHLSSNGAMREHSGDARFAWQDEAFEAASSMRETARERGAFIVNMASTGCGKTLANARVLCALADSQSGPRISYALGLRTLTLQTGRSYRRDLHLGDDELAVLVGGTASKVLFEHYEQKAEASGSASTQALIEEDSHVCFEGDEADHPLLSRALANPDIRKLLSAPMLVCTVDHLAPATESLRAGRQIAPMLRLMGSDLILDELDDYDLDDLPALTRLTYMAGMLGSRVVLSSATLPPALVEGMFMAWRAGRGEYQRNQGRRNSCAEAGFETPCLWADEFGAQVQSCMGASDFADAHMRFVEHRVRNLQAAAPLRISELLPITIDSKQAPPLIHLEFAQRVREACLRLHEAHAEADPVTGKRVSFGLVRMANIEPIFDVAKALCETDMPAGACLHLCVYHARFPLLLRSEIEAMLDATFNRRDPVAAWQLPEVRAALDARDAAPNHLFVVVASPVCEVGRDWDADWALAEPSSMRSLIQLAGRVQRHRRKLATGPNILVFDTNIKGIKARGVGEAIFARPGFERPTPNGEFLLANHSLSKLLDKSEYRHITAATRIRPRAAAELQSRNRWVDLEQARIRACMLPKPPVAAVASTRRSARPLPQLERDFAPACWQAPQAALIGVLPQQQPFREDARASATLVWLPSEGEDGVLPHRLENPRSERRRDTPYPARELLPPLSLKPARGVARWGEFDLLSLIREQAEAQGIPLAEAAIKFTAVEVPHSDFGWRWHPWLGIAMP